MELVEETASYLDGVGRQDSKMLSRSAALAYAGESMRLTTRLMQVASWLLVQRAVREGDMNPVEACQDRYRLADPTEERPTPSDDLPAGLLQLLDRSGRLYERVLHLDSACTRKSRSIRPTIRSCPNGEAGSRLRPQLNRNDTIAGAGTNHSGARSVPGTKKPALASRLLRVRDWPRFISSRSR